MATADLKGFRTNQVSEIDAGASAIGVQRHSFRAKSATQAPPTIGNLQVPGQACAV